MTHPIVPEIVAWRSRSRRDPNGTWVLTREEPPDSVEKEPLTALAYALELQQALEWTARHVSGRAWREAGIDYAETADIPALCAAAARTEREATTASDAPHDHA